MDTADRNNADKTQTMYVLRFLILILLTQSTLAGYGQKIRDKRIEVNYVSLPEQRLPDTFSTYAINVTGSSLRDAGMSPWEVERLIHMNGFTKLESGKKDSADLLIEIDAGTLFEGLALLRSRTVTSKRKDGSSVRFRTYWYEVDFSTSPSYVVLDPDHRKLASGGRPVHKTMKSRDETDPGRLQRSYTFLVRDLREKFVKDAVKDVARLAQSTLSTQFDFAIVREHPQLYFVKNHPEAQAFEKYLDRTELIFKEMSATTPAEEGLSKLSREIAFWEKYAERNPGKDKGARAVWAASRYNLAVVFYYLDRIEDAEAHVLSILAADTKDKRAEALLTQIRKTKELMKLHGIDTMHYVRVV